MSFQIYMDSKNLLVLSNRKSAWCQGDGDLLQDIFMKAANNGWSTRHIKFESLKFIAKVNSYEEFIEQYPEYLI